MQTACGGRLRVGQARCGQPYSGRTRHADSARGAVPARALSNADGPVAARSGKQTEHGRASDTEQRDKEQRSERARKVRINRRGCELKSGVGP